MHPLFQKADELSRTVIEAATMAHRLKGAGLIESIYEKSLMQMLAGQNLSAVNQRAMNNTYTGSNLEEPQQSDVLVEECLLVGIISVKELLPEHPARFLGYMKLLDIPVGLLINFYELKLMNGIHRLVLPGADA